MVEPRVKEEDIPPEFDLQYDESTGKVNRDVTAFSAHRNGCMVSICDLDKTDLQKKEDMQIMLRGVVVSGSKKLRIEVGPLVEWCIEYGNVPALWAHTAVAWYKMILPAKEYQKTHELARRRFELCSRAFILAVTIMAEECTYRNIVNVLGGPYENMKGYTEKEILMERNFILEQADSLEDPSLKHSGFVKELRDRIAKEQVATTGSSVGTTSAKKKDKEHHHRKEKKHRKYGKGSVWKPRTDQPEVMEAMLEGSLKLVSTIMKDKLAWPFLEPVDPVAHGCPTYLDFIAEPMDLGTIRKALERGNVYKSIHQVVRDVRLVWSNCRSFNDDNSTFSQMATKLEGKFEEMLGREEDTLMKKRDGPSAAGDSSATEAARTSSPRVAKKRPRSSAAAKAKSSTTAGDALPGDATVDFFPGEDDDDMNDLLASEFGLSAAERVKRGRTRKLESTNAEQGRNVDERDLGEDDDDGDYAPRKAKSSAAKKVAEEPPPQPSKVVSGTVTPPLPAPPPAVVKKKPTCAARKCKNAAREGSKYCRESCLVSVASMRAKMMAKVMTPDDIEKLFTGELVEIHRKVVQAGAKPIS